MDYFEIISQLCQTPAASGFEQQAADTVKKLMESVGLEVSTDNMGNVYGLRSCGKKNAKTLMLDAHFDEIGFIITGHSKGFLKFETLGGVDPRVLPAREVRILAEPEIVGVFTSIPPHLLDGDASDKAFEKDALYIDAGLSEDQAAELVGTPAVFKADCVRLRNDFISGRALDDRAGLAAHLGAMELLQGKSLNIDIVVLASVQEEVGCRGAQVAGYTVNPDWALAVDVTHATTPDSGKAKTFDAGSGTSIGVGPNFQKSMSDALIRLAKDKGIPYTVEVCAGESGTNAWPIQVARSGIMTGLLSIPLKYMHTPCETLSEKDICATAKLIAEFALEKSALEVRENA